MEPDRRRFSLDTVWGIFMPGGRALDERLRQFGFAVVVALILLGMNYKFMSDERDDRRAQTEALTGAFSQISKSMTGVESRMSSFEGGLEWMRGAAVGRLKCPDLQCAPCVCPPPRVTVTPIATPAPRPARVTPPLPATPDVQLQGPDLTKTPDRPPPIEDLPSPKPASKDRANSEFWKRNR